MEDNKLGLKCTNCDGSDFYLQDGFYFCEECAFQYENLFEMENEWNLNCNHETVKLAKDKPTKHKGEQARDTFSSLHLSLSLSSLLHSTTFNKF